MNFENTGKFISAIQPLKGDLISGDNIYRGETKAHLKPKTKAKTKTKTKTR